MRKRYYLDAKDYYLTMMKFEELKEELLNQVKSYKEYVENEIEELREKMLDELEDCRKESKSEDDCIEIEYEYKEPFDELENKLR